MKSVFIVFSTIHIGGAEKRFTGLWRSFQNSANSNLQIKLILNPGLYEKLIESGELIAGEKNIIVAILSEKNFWQYRKNVAHTLKAHAVKGDIVHFIGHSPVIKTPGIKQLLSLTGTKLNVGGFVNMMLILVSAVFANAIDVLDPVVFKQIKNIFFWKNKRIYRTTNSFCNVELFKPLPYTQKKDWIVFLGRFDAVKQIEKILESLPFIYEKLQQAGKNDFHFYILGHGQLEEKLVEIINRPRYKNIPVTLRYEKNPSVILNQSKIFLSLQLHNNYPSRSLLEAMAAGNIPLVTDTGQTRWIAKPEFSYYVPEKFTQEYLANSLLQIFSMTDNEWIQKSSAARKLVLDEHDIDKMHDYFETLYGDL